MKGETVKVKIRVLRVKFYSTESNYAILWCSIDELLEGQLEKGLVYEATFTGTMIDPKEGDEYTVYAEFTTHPKYGGQYNIIRVESDFDYSRKVDRDRLVEMAFRDTPTLLSNLYATFDDPFQPLVKDDIEALVKVKGIGLRTVHNVLARFHRKYDYGTLYLELYEYNLTEAMCERFLDAYGSADVAIKAIRENPYALIYVVDGVGWKKADAIAMKGGEKQYSLHRVEAFIYYYLQLQGENGNSWIDPSELMGAIQENLGEDIPAYTVTEAIHDIDDKLWYNEEHTQIGLKKYYDIENKLATELLRVKNSVNEFRYDGWEERIKLQEKAQGWEFTDQQIEGIKACLENQLVLITGKGGTGKSSTVSGVLAVLGQYNHAMCALAGKAASRLAEVTGEEGYTIHRLLGYGVDKETGKFGYVYNADNPLPYDIVILDEVSMVNSELFWRLVSAIPSGAKLIMLGDVAQLPPIGIGNTANDLLASPYILTITLDKIHRQAAKSAIITESIAISNGTQIAEKDWIGVETRGELQDLTLNCYHDASNTFYTIMEYYSRFVEMGKSPYDIQVVVPLRVRGDSSVYNLNLAIQAIVNPHKEREPELTVSFMKDYSYTFRVGDKVINRKNNYKTASWSEDGEEMVITPIFNGNIGIIESINTVDRSMVVDFVGIGKILIDGEALRNMQLAYAITCHSAQGSEFDCVIVGMDYSAYTMLSRQWLYTALTRAKKACVLCTQISALRYATYQNEIVDKHTHLQRCIEEQIIKSF